MIKTVYTVYDIKVKAYLQPFFLDTDAQAIRTFGDLINDSTHQFGRHPEDYTLFKLCEFDDQDAVFATAQAPELLSTGLELVNFSLDENKRSLQNEKSD